MIRLSAHHVQKLIFARRLKISGRALYHVPRDVHFMALAQVSPAHIRFFEYKIRV
jgi:hypothetical protein